MPLQPSNCSTCSFCKTKSHPLAIKARNIFPKCTSKEAIERRGTDIVPTNIDCGSYDPIHKESIDGVGN